MPADRVRDLQPNISLAVGARVFINNNVWVSAGLANGAIGEMVHMQLAEGKAPPQLSEWV